MKTKIEAHGPEAFGKYGLVPILPEVFDNSISSEFNSCWRKGFMHYVLGRVPAETDHPLLFGKCWHVMHETFQRSGGDFDQVMDIPNQLLPEFIDDRFNRTRDRIKEAFERWMHDYKIAEQQLEVIRVEEAADLYCPPDADCFLQGCDLHWGGKMDRLVRIHGKLWILDFKTSAYKDDYFGEKLALNSQLRGYAWLLSHLMGERVWGVMIDRAVINSSTINFQRYPHAISDGHMMSLVRNQQAIYADARRKFEIGAYDLNAWQENPDECFRYKKCPYYGVCSTSCWSDTEARLKVLASEYQEKRHDFYNL